LVVDAHPNAKLTEAQLSARDRVKDRGLCSVAAVTDDYREASMIASIGFDSSITNMCGSDCLPALYVVWVGPK
jgi:hypothetical protein